MTNFLVKSIRAAITTKDDEVFDKVTQRIKEIIPKKDIINFSVYKKSIDARRKNNLLFVYSILITVNCDYNYFDAEKLKKFDMEMLKDDSFTIDRENGNEILENPPVIVGFGPCGMFTALLLAENGFKPIVIERGDDVISRAEKVETFYKNKKLDVNSNIQFGAGGAGTFSDGKLVTRINDNKCSYVLKRLHEFGAPQEILINSKPHIGTDKLKVIVTNLKKRITDLGGKIYFNTKMEKINFNLNHIASIDTNHGDKIACGVLIMAIGHSARDTYKMLQENNFDIIPKAFSIGLRIEHLQSDIDKSMYGDMAGNPLLNHAEYAMSYHKGNISVYTFCMCPGGEVVAATSEENSVVVNGMSEYNRDSINANSAIAVSINQDNYGNSVDGAIEFQRNIEKAAFIAGGKNYNAPIQTVGDFLNNVSKTSPTRITPSYMGGNNYNIFNLNKLFPNYINEMLKIGILDFDKKVKGFASKDAILTGVETRTSAPVRIMRDGAFLATGYDNVYPCGEGAGYAGGITSAAVDGINCAIKIMEKYKK